MKMILALLVYFIVCIVSLFLPVAEGYDTFGWKLLIGQIYAIPSSIIFILIWSIKSKYIVKSKTY